MEIPCAEDLVIREVMPEDVAACAAIEAACFTPSEAASYDRIARRAASYRQGFLVALREREIIGFVNSGATEEADLAREELKDGADLDPSGRNIVVFSLTIRPDLQGQGLSRPLFEAFLLRAHALNKRRVLLLCKEYLVPYYAKFGFQDAGPSTSTHGGYTWREMRLELDVKSQQPNL